MHAKAIRGKVIGVMPVLGPVGLPHELNTVRVVEVSGAPGCLRDCSRLKVEADGPITSGLYWLRLDRDAVTFDATGRLRTRNPWNDQARQ